MYQELIVDNFAGGGGASTGIEMAVGRSPDYAINHDHIALAMHAVNHPATEHLCKNVWKVIPSEISRGRPIGLAWFSPDCKHFSKAKGGKPVNRNVRDLGWVALSYAKLPKAERPRVFIIENVEEWEDWGPLVDDRPCPDRKGQTFKRLIREFRKLGYKVEWRQLRGRDYGSPTSRKRLFVIGRNDGLPIVWPKATHGHPESLPVKAGRLKPWRTAARDVIDWSIPCHSIFLTKEEGRAVGVKRPLVPATMARNAKGIDRYVLKHAKPFIVPITHTRDNFRGQSIDDPLATVTAARRGEHAVVVPVIINTRNGERQGQEPRCRDVERPYPTVTAQGSQGAVAVAFLAQHNTDMVGHHPEEPLSTIVGKGCTQAVVSAGLVNMHGSDRRSSAPDEPAPTQTAGGTHQAETRAFLMKYHRDGGQYAEADEPAPTADCKARFGLVDIKMMSPPLSDAQIVRARQVADFLRAHGFWDDREFVTIGPWLMVDIGMRMLTPRELFRAQGFPDSYIIDRTPEGVPITKTDQIRMCGNSVNPQVACAIVAANYVPREVSIGGAEEFALVAAE